MTALATIITLTIVGTTLALFSDKLVELKNYLTVVYIVLTTTE